MNCNGDFYSVFARKRSDRSNPFLRKSLENTKAIELSKRFLSNAESFKDSSDSIESNHNMDCHSPKGLRNDDSIGDSAESSDFNLVDCHEFNLLNSRNDENQGEFMSSYRHCERSEAIHFLKITHNFNISYKVKCYGLPRQAYGKSAMIALGRFHAKTHNLAIMK